MAKLSCSCNPKKGGCPHFLSGNCRLLSNRDTGVSVPCVMRKNSYHYRCCPVYKLDKAEGDFDSRRNKTFRRYNRNMELV